MSEVSITPGIDPRALRLAVDAVMHNFALFRDPHVFGDVRPVRSELDRYEVEEIVCVAVARYLDVS